MEDKSIEALLADLKSEAEEVRELATRELWRRWFTQKGTYGLEILEQSQILMESGKYQQAEQILTQLINDQPDFAEAWNRRAVLYFVQHQYRKSLADCEQVIARNPIHFGAIHGKGLCHAALGEYVAAIQAFQRALTLQPHAVANQRLILECNARLS
jgi:tetratricopeptide (TPR) repeat protein